MLRLNPLPVTHEGVRVTVSSAGKEVIFEDVLIGDLSQINLLSRLRAGELDPNSTENPELINLVRLSNQDIAAGLRTTG